MTRARPIAPILCAAAALVAAAPAIAAGPADAGASADAGSRSSADAGAPADAGAIEDAGEIADAGASADGGDSAELGLVSCSEHIPDGATRPKIEESFPQRGFSGYAARLVVTVTHGKGETVLPEGIRAQREGFAVKALTDAGFIVPEADAGTSASLTTKLNDADAVTTLEVPFVALPKNPGRSSLVLPALPIKISRANGDVVTVCTQPHAIAIEDPIANQLDPKVKPNPPPRIQREDWTFARQLTLGIEIGAAITAVVAYAIYRWRKRPKYVPPPPPPIPWEVALAELDELRRSSLLAEGRNDEYFDRVSDCVRKYLGARYGFDGLESTTDEMRGILKRIRPPVPELKKIAAFLSECDLVKFARVFPGESDCLDLLRRGERIVQMTIPANRRPAGDADAPPPPAVETST